MARRSQTGAKLAGVLAPAFLLMPAALLSNPAMPVSAAFNVTPLRIELDSQTQFETFQVRNESSEKLAVQARGFMWSQQDGEDHFAPTANIAISPSIVEIAPGTIQHFKLLRRQLPTGSDEGSYRLVIDQLPDGRPRQEGATNTRLRVSIPVFVDRNKAAPARLAWSASDGALRVANGGGRSVKFGQMAIATADGRTFDLSAKGPRYALAAGSAVWALPAQLSCIPAGSFVTGSIDNAPLREPIQQNCG